MSNWIKVEDKLPAPGQKVLCCFIPKHPLMSGTDIDIFMRIDHKPAVKIPCDKNGFLTSGEVLVWMPLPKRYNP